MKLTNSAISVFTLFAANIYQLKSVYLSIRASSRKKPLRILSSHFTPSRMLVWRVWFCLQDSSSTQDLHLECQRGNSGIQWLSGLLWCFFDFDAAACFLPSIVNHCMVHVEWSCLSTSKPSRLLDISTTLTAPTALIHVYCFLKYDYIISRWITEYQ